MKSEIRSTKSETNSNTKLQMTETTKVLDFPALDFGFVSDFVLRILDFGFHYSRFPIPFSTLSRCILPHPARGY